eukprot:1211847-Amorphochlora_amoeboformis.AAC.1
MRSSGSLRTCRRPRSTGLGRSGRKIKQSEAFHQNKKKGRDWVSILQTYLDPLVFGATVPLDPLEDVLDNFSEDPGVKGQVVEENEGEKETEKEEVDRELAIAVGKIDRVARHSATRQSPGLHRLVYI